MCLPWWWTLTRHGDCASGHGASTAAPQAPQRPRPARTRRVSWLRRGEATYFVYRKPDQSWPCHSNAGRARHRRPTTGAMNVVKELQRINAAEVRQIPTSSFGMTPVYHSLMFPTASYAFYVLLLTLIWQDLRFWFLRFKKAWALTRHGTRPTRTVPTYTSGAWTIVWLRGMLSPYFHR